MGDFLAILAGGAFTLFCMAWVTILPTIGLLWVLGWIA